ncbi:MAG: 2-oxoglutarate dehydrogenase complex dihydrolipoyllysine-residue succinyltransferase [SAR324 cluster bacterium]|nr:2-oxoglutarate dehydrogenase complex dihydrolipoyllysine-residue succinyltransferase [SAR324 cluster bacterium]
MLIDTVVPDMGESISEATVSSWLKASGDAVADGDILVELETDKVMVEVPANGTGVMAEILKQEGDTVVSGDVLCKIDTEARAAAPQAEPQPTAPAPPQEGAARTRSQDGGEPSLTPAARRMVAEHGLNAANITGSGRHGQVTKEDIVNFMELGPSMEQGPSAPAAPVPVAVPATIPASGAKTLVAEPSSPGERETRVRMTRLRQRIAERLVEVQQTAAILTTFNEVDMSAVMALRTKYKEAFREKYGMAVGFMSFFTKACIEALKAFPAVNGEVDGQDIIYKNYYDIGVAVGTDRGLVVPIVRDADRLRFIEIELEIADLAKRARESKLGVDDLTGGTFTISNGGIYGSMLSTPILNPPQSGILGMHNIIKRPMVVEDQIVVLPMMYLALSYDHRIIDGREAVQFLIKVKQGIEDPSRMLLEI